MFSSANAYFERCQPVITVSGDEFVEGNELMRKRPSGATSYRKLARFGAMMRVWNTTCGSPVAAWTGSNVADIIFLSGAMK